jgi:hypothetical protein
VPKFILIIEGIFNRARELACIEELQSCAGGSPPAGTASNVGQLSYALPDREILRLGVECGADIVTSYKVNCL